MLTRLLLKNFQKHKKQDIKLGQITTLVGSSEAGKSAIIRALHWAFRNKPTGDGFIRDGSKDTSVGVEFDGHSLIRSRGKKGNTYSLDGEKHVAFGNNVPEPIADLVNVSEVNFQQQDDGVFWILLSPAALSKKLNDIVDLAVIDNVLRDTKSLIKRYKTIRDHEQGKLEEIETTVKELAWVKEAEAQWARIQAAKLNHATSNAQHTALLTKSGNLTSLQATHKKARKRLQAVEAIAGVELDRNQTVVTYYKLNEHVVDLTSKEALKKDAVTELAAKAGIGFITSDERARLKKIVGRITKQKESKCQSEKELKSLKSSIEKFSTKHRCETCGSIQFMEH